jgi:uncharacterized membrane protein YdjX (TVP38/TMEM64 family)
MASHAKDHMTLPMWRRLIPVAVLLLGLALFLLLDLERYFSVEMLSRHHATLTSWVAGHVALAVFLFVVVYALVVAFSLPIAVVVTPVGGFLFGLWLGALLSVIGATIGSAAVFLAARTAFYDLFHARAGAALARLEEGFRRDSFSYLLFLRLVPVFPFWLVNIVPALLGMALGPYTLATLIGIIPGAVVYSSVGSGLGMLIDRGEMPNLGIIFEWRILLPLLGLAVLALVPVLYTHLRARKTSP